MKSWQSDETSDMNYLSIIVPVYNVKQYLLECVESLLEYRYIGNYEVILVNDGSTDGSEKICEQLELDNPNIVSVIHKANGGLASARNAGLQAAKGLYIAFVDSDDRLAKDAVPNTIDAIKNTSADVCFMQGYKFYPNEALVDLGDSIKREDIIHKNRKQILEYISSRPKYPGSACTKVYRRLFLFQNNIVFPAGNRRSEDLGFVLDCLLQAERFEAFDFPFYEYRQGRLGSITSTPNTKSFLDLAIFIDESINKIMNIANERKECKSLLNSVAYEYVILIWISNYVDDDTKSKAIEVLNKYKWLLKYSNNKVVSIARKIISIFGIKRTARLLFIYKNNSL